MDKAAIIELVRLALAATGFLRTMIEKGDPAVVKAALDELRADGALDLADLDKAIGGLDSRLADLDAKIAARGG